MALFRAASRDMSFDGVTEGININEVDNYINYLKVDVVDKIITELNDVADINNAINRGWQGQSRDNFLRTFDNYIESTGEEIKNEFTNLRQKINDLAISYYEQDAKMVDRI